MTCVQNVFYLYFTYSTYNVNEISMGDEWHPNYGIIYVTDINILRDV